MQCPVRTFGQRLTNSLRSARGPGAQGNHFARMLLFQLQSFFERVSVRLVHLETDIVLFTPAPACIDVELRIAYGDLLDGTDNFHEWRGRAVARLVSPRTS